MIKSVFIERELDRNDDERYERECPQCNLRAAFHFCHSTEENDVSCSICGYYYSRTLVIDQERTSLDPYKRDLVKLDENGYAVYDIQEKKGFGVSSIRLKTGGEGNSHQFHEPITSEDVDEFETNISLPDVDRENSYLTRWNDGLDRVELLIGYCPDLIFEFLNETQNQHTTGE